MDNIEDVKSGAQIKLDLKIDHSAADGKTSNKAKVTVTQNGLALNNWGIRFSISGGSAIFSNGKNTFDTKTANGIAYAEFNDDVIESGTITVIETTNDMNQPITNGSSDSKPYHFGPDGEVTYNLTMKKIDDGVAADGIAQDSASVIIKDKNNNTPASGTFIITFTSSSNTTKFDVSKSNVDKRSTSSTLYVNATLNNDGGLEALAYFSDTVKEDAVTITASLLDNQPTQPQDAQFSFKEIAYNLTLKKISDGAAADGIAQDSASVIIKDKNNNTPTSGTFIITFTSSSNTTKFDVSKSNVDKRSTSSTLYVNATLNDDGELEALAYFSDTVEEDAVTITASLLDNQSTKTQDAQFSFKSDKWLLTAKDAYSNAQADGIQTNIIGVNISLNGKSVPEGLNPIIQLELDNSDVSFDLKGALPGSTSSKYLIKARPNDTGDFNDCLVGFKADKPCSVNVSVSVPSVKEIKPQSIPFSFRPNYILKLEKQIDNQKNDGSDNSLVAKVTTNDPNGPNKSFLIRFYTENSDFVLFDMAGVDIDKSRSRPTDIYANTRFINDKDPYQWVQAGFYSYSPGTVTIRAQIFGYYNSDAQKSEDFTFIDYDPNQFVFDNNIFRSTENVTAYYKCLDTKGKPIIGKNIIFAISDANFYINNTDKPVEKQTDSNGIAQVQIRGLYTGVNEVTNLEIYVDNLPEYKKLFYYNSSPFKISIGEPEKVGSEILCNLTRFPPGDDPIQVQLSIVDESLTPDEDVYFVLNNSNKMTATVLSTPYNVSLASRKSKTSRLYVSFKNGDDEQYRSVPIVFE